MWWSLRKRLSKPQRRLLHFLLFKIYSFCFYPQNKSLTWLCAVLCFRKKVNWDLCSRRRGEGEQGNCVTYLPWLHNLHLSQVVPGSFSCKDKALFDNGNIQASTTRTTFTKILRHCVPFPPSFFNTFRFFLLLLFACSYFVLNHAVYRIARNLGITAKQLFPLCVYICVCICMRV